MCTVTIVPLRFAAGEPMGLRLACNRDELRSRLQAEPPRRLRIGAREAAMPLDPAGGGTWVGVNDAGLVMALLNSGSSAERRDVGATTSRGLVIPALLERSTLADVKDAIERHDLSELRSFRLVATNRSEAFEARWNRERLAVSETAAIIRPLLFTSSSLGDDLVESPRRRLFDEMLNHEKFSADAPTDAFAAQQAFHRHRWPDRSHVSVSMRRADARTVSFTAIELHPNRAHVTYHPDAPDEAVDLVEITLPLRAPLRA